MSKVCDLIDSENGLSVKLRCENYFDVADYENIKTALKENVPVWKKNGSVPVNDMVAIMELIDQLAGGSRFWNEKTAIQAESACIEIHDILLDMIR